MVVSLLDLSDDLLYIIVQHVLSPIAVAHHSRISSTGLARALPLAQTCHRLLRVVTASLIDFEPWPSARLNDYGLQFIAQHSATTLRRLVLRGCNRLSAHALVQLVIGCKRLKTLDLSHIVTVDDVVLNAVATIYTLQSLLIRRCTRVTDIGIKIVAERCESLSALDMGGLVRVTDDAVCHLATLRAKTLKIVILSWCTQLTDIALAAVGRTNVRAVFLRGLLISDAGVEAMIKGIGTRLVTIDLLDCPNVTNGVFRALREGCANMRDKLQHIGKRDLFQNALSVLDGYVHVVSGVDGGGGKATLVCVVDAGLANAFAFRVLSGEGVCFERDEVRVIASNSGLMVSRETRKFVRDSFGIEV